jgi:hypothetical protein
MANIVRYSIDGVEKTVVTDKSYKQYTKAYPDKKVSVFQPLPEGVGDDDLEGINNAITGGEMITTDQKFAGPKAFSEAIDRANRSPLETMFEKTSNPNLPGWMKPVAVAADVLSAPGDVMGPLSEGLWNSMGTNKSMIDEVGKSYMRNPADRNAGERIARSPLPATFGAGAALPAISGLIPGILGGAAGATVDAASDGQTPTPMGLGIGAAAGALPYGLGKLGQQGVRWLSGVGEDVLDFMTPSKVDEAKVLLSKIKSGKRAPAGSTDPLMDAPIIGKDVPTFKFGGKKVQLSQTSGESRGGVKVTDKMASAIEDPANLAKNQLPGNIKASTLGDPLKIKNLIANLSPAQIKNLEGVVSGSVAKGSPSETAMLQLQGLLNGGVPIKTATDPAVEVVNFLSRAYDKGNVDAILRFIRQSQLSKNASLLGMGKPIVLDPSLIGAGKFASKLPFGAGKYNMYGSMAKAPATISAGLGQLIPNFGDE